VKEEMLKQKVENLEKGNIDEMIKKKKKKRSLANLSTFKEALSKRKARLAAEKNAE